MALSEPARTTPTGSTWAGNPTQLAYDGLGRLLQAIGALGSNTAFAYDALGRFDQPDRRAGIKSTRRFDAGGPLP
jgi:uncharacterized protein RhaS with RHS repeats